MTSLGIAPVSRKSIETQATDALRDAIVAGHLAPGSRITESQLAKEMSLSRASVRSALQQLQKDGLTTLIPYTGWTIVSLSANDVWELYTLRSGMERLAARMLAESADAGRKKAFKRAFDVLIRACESGNQANIAEADFGLHKSLIEQSGHGRLAIQYETIERQIRMCIRSSDALLESPAAILEQHRPLVDAILAGHSEDAAAIAESHNLTEGAKLREHLGKNQLPPEEVLRPSRGTTRLQHQKPRSLSASS